MTDQDNDDEIRESIPCHVYEFEGFMYCLPVGYTIDELGAIWRGVPLGKHLDEPAVWQHAIEREKARRAKAKEQAEAAKVRLEEAIAHAGGMPISFVRGETPSSMCIVERAKRERVAEELREIAEAIRVGAHSENGGDDDRFTLESIASQIERGDLP
jgi:hypothetical protein